VTLTRLLGGFLCGIAALGPSARGGEPPTNGSLVACMPPGTESVWVVRDSELGAEDSIMRPLMEEMRKTMGRGGKLEHREDLRPFVDRAIAQAAPVVHALGGSKFTRPKSLGMGSYVDCAVWVTKGPVAELKAKLEKPEGITGPIERTDIDGVVVYGGKSVDMALTPGLPYFVAIPDENTVVTGSRREDVEHIVRSLRSKRSEARIPARWARAASYVRLEAPMVILRAYDAANEKDAMSPVNPSLPQEHRARVDSLGAAFESVTEAAFAVAIITDESDRALAAYQRILRFGTERQAIDHGFTAKLLLAARQGEPAPGRVYLHAMVMFGMNIAI